MTVSNGSHQTLQGHPLLLCPFRQLFELRRAAQVGQQRVAAYRQHWPMVHINAALPSYLFPVAQGEREHPPVLKHAQSFCDSARTLGLDANWIVLKDRTHMSAIRKISEKGDPAFVAIRDFVVAEQKSHSSR